MTDITATSTAEDVAARVSEALTAAGITAVLSGGGAVQIYSGGLYVSRDLDFVSPATLREIEAALAPLGFRRSEGRHFIHAECPFTLEFPPWPLAVGRELIRDWSHRPTAHGVIQMLTPTQCAMDRLAAFYFWKDRQGLDQAVAVAQAHRVDREVIRRWSEREGHTKECEEFLRRI